MTLSKGKIRGMQYFIRLAFLQSSFFALNRCAADDTVSFLPSSDRHSVRWSAETFKFVGEHSYVFIHCKVKVCNATDPNSWCAQGCQPRSKRGTKALPNTPNDVYPLAQGPFALNRGKRKVAVADEAVVSDQGMPETQSGKYFLLLSQGLCRILKKKMLSSLSTTCLSVWRKRTNFCYFGFFSICNKSQLICFSEILR